MSIALRHAGCTVPPHVLAPLRADSLPDARRRARHAGYTGPRVLASLLTYLLTYLLTNLLTTTRLEREVRERGHLVEREDAQRAAAGGGERHDRLVRDGFRVGFRARVRTSATTAWLGLGLGLGVGLG